MTYEMLSRESCEIKANSSKASNSQKEIISLELIFLKVSMQDFSGDPVVKNLPASAGDLSSIPGPGRSQMLWIN